MAHGNVQRGREDAAVQRALRVEHERIDLEGNGAALLIVRDLHPEKSQEKKGAELLALLAERPIKHLPCAVSAHLFVIQYRSVGCRELMPRTYSRHRSTPPIRHPEVLGANAPSHQRRRPLAISRRTKRADHPSRPARVRGL